MSYDDWIKDSVDPALAEMFPRSVRDYIKMLIETAHNKGKVEAYKACTEKLKSLG